MNEPQERRVVIGEIVEEGDNVDTQLDRAKLETRIAIHKRWSEVIVFVAGAAAFAVCCNAVCG